LARPRTCRAGARIPISLLRYGIAALTAALLHRDATGQGQYVVCRRSKPVFAPRRSFSTIQSTAASQVRRQRRTTRARTARTRRAGWSDTSPWRRHRGTVAVLAWARAILRTIAGADGITRPHRQRDIERTARWCADQDVFELADRLQRWRTELSGVATDRPVRRPATAAPRFLRHAESPGDGTHALRRSGHPFLATPA
jgi:crotonobetainyl-CoA:carnitine CoA-transferase CaiB-like acyl-CoA transferase